MAIFSTFTRKKTHPFTWFYFIICEFFCGLLFVCLDFRLLIWFIRFIDWNSISSSAQRWLFRLKCVNSKQIAHDWLPTQRLLSIYTGANHISNRHIFAQSLCGANTHTSFQRSRRCFRHTPIAIFIIDHSFRFVILSFPIISDRKIHNRIMMKDIQCQKRAA